MLHTHTHSVRDGLSNARQELPDTYRCRLIPAKPSTSVFREHDGIIHVRAPKCTGELEKVIPRQLNVLDGDTRRAGAEDVMM